MGFVKELIKRVKGAPVGKLVDDIRLYKSLREILSGTSTVPQPYKTSIWVYAAIRTIAENISRCPLRLRKDNGDKDEPSYVEEGELYNLFQNPNPLMTQETLIEATFIYLMLRGEVFWIFEGREDVTKIPKEIWTFDPQRFTAVTDKVSGLPLGWEYRGKNNESIVIPASQVLHFRMFNPYDDIRGLSPLDAARLSVEQDYNASLYNKAFFENGAKLGGYIFVDGNLDDTQYTRLINQFEDRHKGVGKAHKIAIIEGKGDFKEAKVTQKEMDFIKGKQMSREEILAIYKVNEVVLGLYKDIKSYEGIKSAHKSFWEECLVPKMTFFENYLWSMFFSKVGMRRGKGRVWGQFDLANVGPLQANYSEKVDTGYKMWQMGWPINAINKRLELGMPDVPWGNDAYIPGGYLPVADLLAGNYQGNTNPNPKEPAKKPKKAIAMVSPLMIEDKTEVITPAKAEDIENDVWKVYLAYQTPLEKEFKSEISKFFFEQRKKVLSSVFVNNLKDKRWKDFSKLECGLAGNYLEAIHKGVATICYETGNVIEEALPDYTYYIDNRVKEISNAYQALMTELMHSVEEFSKTERSKDKVADRVRIMYNQLGKKSVETARRESACAFAYGRFEGMRLLGISYHKWFSDREVVSDECKYLHGKVAPVGGTFYEGVTLTHPGVTDIFSRSFTIPLLEEEVS